MMVFSKVSAVEQVLFKFEQNIDNEIVKIIGSDDKTEGVVFVTKSYLQARKAKVNPEFSKYKEFYIKNSNRSDKQSLFRTGSKERVIIGKSVRVNNSYIIPIVRSNSSIEGYKYIPSTGKLDKIFTSSEIKNRFVSAVYALSKGYIVVSSSRLYSTLNYYSYDDVNNYSARLMIKQENISAINDIVERDGNIYIAGNSAKKGRYTTWVYRLLFDEKIGKGEFSFIHSGNGVSKNTVLYSKLIFSASQHLNLLVMKSSIYKKETTVEVVQLSKNNKILWSKDVKGVGYNRHFSVSGYCGNTTLIISKTTSMKPYTQSIKLRLIDENGKSKAIDVEENYKNEMVLSMMLYGGDHNFYVLANFSKFENVRRKNGWYSWYGYRLDRLNEKCLKQ